MDTSSEKKWRVTSNGAKQTEDLAGRLASNLKGGEVIELVSDLGGGKTTFVRGLARGLGSPDVVNSPTFKISNVYHSPKLTINHFDLYRLSEPGLVSYELAEVIDDPMAICVIEWGAIATGILPEVHLTIQIDHADEHDRNITFHYPKELAYLLEGITS